MLIATQLLICGVVVLVLVFSFKTISYHNNDILQTVALKDTEECMKEMVNNTIIRIELKKNTSLEETNKLIDLTAQILLTCHADTLYEKVKTISSNLYQMEYGSPIQITIRNARGRNVTQFSGGEVVTRSSKSDLAALEHEVASSKLHKSITVGESTVDLYACETKIDDIVKKHMYQEIHNANYADNEYIWVNEIVDFSGGDKYAIRRIHPNLKDTEGSYLSTNMQDIKGNLPYQKELNGIKNKGEVLQTYFFKNRTNDEITQKISYAKLYKPFNWVIATGKPLNDIFLYTDEMKDKNIKLIHNTMIVCLFLMITIFIFGITLITFVHRKYREKVDSYVQTETEIDALTGAYNRKVGENILDEYFARTTRNQHTALPLVMALDIDNFKNINDSYGHGIGDIVLKKVVEALLATKKESDYLFRWGGEEFILFCNDEQMKHQTMGKKILRCINEIEFKNNEDCFRVTVSVGSSYFHKEDTHYAQAIKRADVALYHSKNTGKNKYTNFEESSLEGLNEISNFNC